MAATAPSPQLLTTPKQREQRAALRRAGAHTRLPAGMRFAAAAAASARARDGVGRMVAAIAGSIIEDNAAQREGGWRIEALRLGEFVVHALYDEGSVCAICFDAPLGDAAQPCAHAFACAACAPLFVAQPCPICRAPVREFGAAAGGAVFSAGVDLAPETHVTFKVQSEGKRNKAWRVGFRDDIVLLRDRAELAAALRAVDGVDAFTTLTDYAAASPSVFWSAVALADAPPTDDAVLGVLCALRADDAPPAEHDAKRARSE